MLTEAGLSPVASLRSGRLSGCSKNSDDNSTARLSRRRSRTVHRRRSRMLPPRGLRLTRPYNKPFTECLYRSEGVIRQSRHIRNPVTSAHIRCEILTVHVGVRIDGLLFDAGTTNSSALLTVGTQGSTVSHASNPISVQDTFFRIGGDIAGQATSSLVVNANNTLVDDIWAWRADHGNSGTFGWTVNTAAHGLVVNGANVLAIGLFVEHYQNYDVQWNGNGGETIFFQNEMPYDPPNQAAWMNGTSDGYAAYEVAPNVTSHTAYGSGALFFNVNPAVVADHAFEAPAALRHPLPRPAHRVPGRSRRDRARHQRHRRGDPVQHHPGGRHQLSLTPDENERARPDQAGPARRNGGGGDGNRTRVQGFAGPCLSHSATPPQSSATKTLRSYESGRRDSNPRPSPWQGDALPAEPRPHRIPLGVRSEL